MHELLKKPATPFVAPRRLAAGAPKQSAEAPGSGHNFARIPVTTDDPRLDALRAALHKSLEEKAARQKMNGAIAAAIAHAYVNRPKSLPSGPTQYLDDKTAGIVQEPAEEEVYFAVVDALEGVNLAGGAKAWRWRPAADPNAGRRDDTPTEIAKWLTDQIEDHLVSEAIEFTAEWLHVGGLLAVAQLAMGNDRKGYLERAVSIMELIQTLQKPVKRPLYKYERILLSVMSWMAGEQEKAEAERKAQQKAFEIGPFSTRPLLPDALNLRR